jgi:hypothetical protein
MMKIAEHVERIGAKTCRVLVRKFEERRPIGRPRSRWVLKELGRKGVVWNHVAQVRDRLWDFVKKVMNVQDF